MPNVVLLGIAQDGGVPQAGCSCPRCISVHNQQSDELFPVSLGIEDDDGKYHLIEASRTMAKQFFLWSSSSSSSQKCCNVVSPITSVTLTHLHLGHVDGLGQFGREVMGKQDVRLYVSEKVLSALQKRGPILEPFDPYIIPKDKNNTIQLGKGVTLEFYPVPHRDMEGQGDTHAIVIRGEKRSILFLPDHDTWNQTLALHQESSIRSFLSSLKVDVALIDGTFWSYEELGTTHRDFSTIPHPPITQTLKLLGKKKQQPGIDPDIFFIHFNHTNPILDSNSPFQSQVESLGWKIGRQGMSWEI